MLRNGPQILQLENEKIIIKLFMTSGTTVILVSQSAQNDEATLYVFSYFRHTQKSLPDLKDDWSANYW